MRLSQPLVALGRHVAEAVIYRPKRFLLAVFLLWLAYLILVLQISEKGFAPSLDAVLEITFAITAPQEAIADLQISSSNSQFVLSRIGWLFIAAWALVIPALLAVVIEAMPGVKETLYFLMDPEAAEFLQAYVDAITAQERVVLHFVRNPTGLTFDRRRRVVEGILQNVAELTRFWFRQRREIRANASYIHVVSGRNFPYLNALVLYAPGTRAGDHDELLEVLAFAYEVEHMPTVMLLALDRAQPVLGAARTLVTGDIDGISNTLDRNAWLQSGLSNEQVNEAITFFQTVPFRSFVCLPVPSPDTRSPCGVLTLQSDKEGTFATGRQDADNFLELMRPFCVLLGAIEKS